MNPINPADTKSGEPLDESALVVLQIPCAPEYVGTARLAILGVASRMGFSYDQIEDIRLAVGEACTNAIERGSKRSGEKGTLIIRSQVEPSRLTIEVEDHIGGTSASPLDVARPAVEIDDLDNQELGALLMEILVDEVAVEELENQAGTRVRLVKYAGAN